MKTNGRKGKESENYRQLVQTSSVPWIRPLVTSISLVPLDGCTVDDAL